MNVPLGYVNVTQKTSRLTNSVYLNLVGYVKPRDELFKIFFIDVDGLIGRAAPPKVAHVLLLNLESAVDYHVGEVSQLPLDALKLVHVIPSPYPNVGLRRLRPHAARQLKENGGVAGVQGLAARQGQPPAVHPRVLKVADDAVSLLITEAEAARERPRGLIVAVRAVMGTAGYEQGAAGAGAVDNIDGNVFEVSHVKP